jgi:hypothetical protein
MFSQSEFAKLNDTHKLLVLQIILSDLCTLLGTIEQIYYLQLVQALNQRTPVVST